MGPGEDQHSLPSVIDQFPGPYQRGLSTAAWHPTIRRRRIVPPASGASADDCVGQGVTVYSVVENCVRKVGALAVGLAILTW